MSKFTEAQLEQAIIDLLGTEGYTHVMGESISRDPNEVLIKEDLTAYLSNRYAKEHITLSEIDSIIRTLENFSASDLYETNKRIMKMVSEGFYLKREDHKQKDLHVHLIDYSDLVALREPQPEYLETIGEGRMGAYNTKRDNIYKVVNQLEICGYEKRIPDGILYINGLPLVVFEFKSAIREKATIHDAHVQLTIRYRRDIPELFKFNAFCVISDGVNSRLGSLFTQYDHFSSWRISGRPQSQNPHLRPLPHRTRGDYSSSPSGRGGGEGSEAEAEGISSLFTMIEGLFNQRTIRDVIRNFIFFPDTSRKEEKIVCRYPQYYATNKLYESIRRNRRPEGEGKGGTYFGATGCGKSYTMLFLSRLLMKSVEFASPTIVLITDRTDLDTQLSEQFTNAKGFIGDDTIISVDSRDNLRELLRGRNSGGVFLTTIHKFTEDIRLLTERNNVICISDEAHRSQVNLDQKVTVTAKGVFKTYGFAKYLHDSLPNATYVGFTGTPIDATYDVFGELVDAYSMADSVRDKITVKIVYEGRAAKVILDNEKLQEIERYYRECADAGTNEYQIEESKRANTNINLILGDIDRLRAVAADFIGHYERRVNEGATVKGKALFVCSSRENAFKLYKEIIALRPEWNEKKVCEEGSKLTEDEKKKIMPLERIKMVMTRGQDDEPELYDLIGPKEYRKELDRQFKVNKSNFRIAIVVDMWLTGFDVPALDTLYIDKPVQKHTLIQTISRVNRRFEGKDKGLVVDYIGIKSQMDEAINQYGDGGDGGSSPGVEGVNRSITIVKDHLELLKALFHKFDTTPYFQGSPMNQLKCLKRAAEFVQATEKQEQWYMYTVRRLKLAYDICCGSDAFSQSERDHIHFYLAVRSIIFKLTTGDTPDISIMNAKVQAMIEEALKSNGVEEVIKLCDNDGEIDIFDEKYMKCLCDITEPNTKLKLLLKLLKKAIDDFAKTNKFKSIHFSDEFKTLVDRYNDREDDDLWRENILKDFTGEIMDMLNALKKEAESYKDLGINFEEKAFYDILKGLTVKYEFEYPDDKLLELSKEVKKIVDDKTRYPNWDSRGDIKAELKVDLVLILAEYGYPPVDRDEVYKEIFEQAENFKKHQKA